jgi:GNAT superfamily N-acetyltransferase
MEIGERVDVDLDQLVAVAGRVHEAGRYPIFLPDDDFHRFLTRPEPAAPLVAIRDGSVVGHIALNAETSGPVMQLVAALDSKRPALYVARLLVDPSARRAGIGKMLLEQARRAAVDSRHTFRSSMSSTRQLRRRRRSPSTGVMSGKRSGG